jgi:hypothetical protein
MFFLSAARNGTATTVTEYARHDAAPPSEKECDRASFRAASTVHTVRVIAPRMSESDWRRVSAAAAAGGASGVVVPPDAAAMLIVFVSYDVSGSAAAVLQDAGGADTALRSGRAHVAVISPRQRMLRIVRLSDTNEIVEAGDEQVLLAVYKWLRGL